MKNVIDLPEGGQLLHAPQARRPVVDFHHVEEHQRDIHARLENWAAWSHNPRVVHVAAGFDGYQSPSVVDRHRRDTKLVVEGDARRIAAAVVQLPQHHRLALCWCYIKRSSPKRGCQDVGTTMEGLYRYIRDGRQMLINRGI